MESGAIEALDLDLYRRGQLITSLSRWLSVGLAAPEGRLFRVRLPRTVVRAARA